MIDAAVRAEGLGFDSVWASHHVMHPPHIRARIGDRPYYDALTVLTYVAAVTRKVRLGTSVLVLPYVNPLVLAKGVATLDVLSGGRVILGVGVGSSREEFDAVGSDFNQRGAYADEIIEAMTTLWTQEEPSFNGRFFSFSGLKFSPKPLQKPYPPLWVGGSSEAALRRAALVGDGWHPDVDGVSLEALAARIERLKAHVAAAKRSMSDITLSVRLTAGDITSPTGAERAISIGEPDQALTTIEAYARLGINEVVLGVSPSDRHRLDRMMEAFSKDIMPLAKKP